LWLGDVAVLCWTSDHEVAGLDSQTVQR